MHEMSLAVAVVDQVETVARSRGAVGVSSIELEVGELAGVVADALAFCFELACAGTVVEGAELITRTVPGTARCAPCAEVWAVGMPPLLLCPGCVGRQLIRQISHVVVLDRMQHEHQRHADAR
ncbi:hydrogenase maturation nickel metallochaperone HypA, partial [Streptomyces tanashiensis]|uniref:hydrogenase maturation nickel metallochaperone HypA/HybF n=1 Tax=Streptomyces tanashiensis TaxID=67367 RepID=UPI0033FA00E4